MHIEPDEYPCDHDRVAVIVVMYKSEELLPDFVTALRIGMEGVPYELVAVDNASPDASGEVMEKLAPEAVIAAPSLGAPAGARTSAYRRRRRSAPHHTSSG